MEAKSIKSSDDSDSSIRATLLQNRYLCFTNHACGQYYEGPGSSEKSSRWLLRGSLLDSLLRSWSRDVNCALCYTPVVEYGPLSKWSRFQFPSILGMKRSAKFFCLVSRTWGWLSCFIIRPSLSCCSRSLQIPI